MNDGDGQSQRLQSLGQDPLLSPLPPPSPLPPRVGVDGLCRGCNLRVWRHSNCSSTPLCHLHMKASAPSSTRQHHHLPAFCAASRHPSNLMPTPCTSLLATSRCTPSPVPRCKPLPWTSSRNIIITLLGRRSYPYSTCNRNPPTTSTSAVCPLPPRIAWNLSWKSRRLRTGRGRRASFCTGRDVGGAGSGGPVVASVNLPWGAT